MKYIAAGLGIFLVVLTGWWVTGWLLSEVVEVFTAEEYAFSNWTYLWTGAFASAFISRG